MSAATDRREREVIRAFVNLSHELVVDYDIVDMLLLLTKSCANLLDVASAGLLLADDRGVLHLAASSSERMHHLEVLQLQRDEGPCLDCYRDGELVVSDLTSEAAVERWPQFAPAAAAVGYASVHAVPMMLRGQVLGTLGLFGEAIGRLDDDDVALAQALVHVATVALVNEKSASDRETINSQLQHALTSRIVLEQAKGVIANESGLDMGEAFEVLRRYARHHGIKLTEAATLVVNRELHSSSLVTEER